MEAAYVARYGDLQRWHWWFRGREKILARVLDRELHTARPSDWRRVVSVGCGPPAGLQWLTAFVQQGGRVVGLDADPSGALRRALAEARWLPPEGVGFVVGRLEDPPIRRGSCDVVLALDVLEHLEDDGGGLASMADLLVPGGLLLVTVPALPSLWGAQDIVSHHHRRYTRRDLTETFRRARLPAPRTTYFNSLLFPPIAAVRWTRRLLGWIDEGKSDFDSMRPGPVNELLARLFGAERHLVGRLGLPVGVSLLAVGRAPGGPGDQVTESVVSAGAAVNRPSRARCCER